ncbi:PepSY domain-containing protein [Spiribacter vilamensis]|nr:PepSY domain-containing protein [Spiribacter vilamensis]
MIVRRPFPLNTPKPVMRVLLCIACSLPLVSLAGDEERRGLREQIESGKLLPLTQIIETLRRDYRGEVLEVELEDEDSVRLYEIELLGPDGQIVEFVLDAATGEIIGMEGSKIDQMRRDP